MAIPEIRFAKSGDVHIAYQIVGAGSVDVVWIHDWISNLELQWEEPACARFLDRLASFSRLLLFDKRGSGLSDRTVDLDLFTLEVRLDDVRAVLDAVGSRQAVIFGHGDDGAGLAAVFAATHPERTRALILYGARAKDLSTDGYAFGYEPSSVSVWISETENFWGSDMYARRWLAALAPSVAHDQEVLQRYSRLLRQSASPGTEIAFELNTHDVRAVLSAIHVPTLVLHRSGDADLPVAGGRDLAERIEDARFVALPGVDSIPWFGDQDALLDEVEQFVMGSERHEDSDRVLVTVLFTDIVGSTDKAVALGDKRWQELLDVYNGRALAEIERFRGTLIETVGDGLLATFDGPARAVRCSHAISDAAASLDLRIRAGCHTGEVERSGGSIRGIAVHIGARVAALAPPGAVLVTSTVKDLATGSGIVFEDSGEHELKGVPGRWRLYRGNFTGE